MATVRLSWMLLGRYLLPHWPGVLLLSALLVAELACSLAGPLVARSFIDSALAGATNESLLSLAGLFLAVSIVGQCLGVAAMGLAVDLGTRTTNQLRDLLTDHALRLDPPFHHTHLPGDMIQRLDADLALLGGLFSNFAAIVLSQLMLLIGVLVLITVEDWRAGLVISGYAALVVATLLWLRQRATREFRALLNAFSATYGLIEERLGGTEDLRALGAVPYVVRRFAEVCRQRARATMHNVFYGDTVFLVAITGGYLGSGVALGVGAWLFLTGVGTVGTIYLLYAYTLLLREPLGNLTRQIQVYQRAAASLGRVQELFDSQPAVRDGRGVPIPAGPPRVTFEDVSFSYGDTTVLHDLTLEIHPGEVIGLLGRTGSGKTSLGRLLSRLYDPAAGSIRFNGVDLRDATVAAVRSRVGIVTQDVQLFAASIRDNVSLFRGIPNERLLAVVHDLGLDDWLARQPAGLDALLAPGGGQLSAGEAQLLAFARVFLRDPDLIILDEASSRLDPATERRIEAAIDRLLAGRTAIVIAHRLGTVDRADRIAILDEGRLVEWGDREALAADPSSRFSSLLAAGLVPR